MQDNEKKLKYLDFVLVAAIYGIVCVTSLYEFAKENSGPLKSGVQTVEGTVKTVLGPVYEKFHDVPFELLMFVDRKVGNRLSVRFLCTDFNRKLGFRGKMEIRNQFAVLFRNVNGSC